MLMKVAAQYSHIRVAAEALDGLDLSLVTGHGEHQARARRLAIDEDGAGTAYPVLAAKMGPGKIAALAQKIRQ